MFSGMTMPVKKRRSRFATRRLLAGMLVGLWAFASTTQASERIYYYHNDHLGTPQFMTDADQNLVWQAGQDPFGADPPVVATVDNNMRFPGQYYDSETGLHYNWNRYYSPETGRYISSDPIGLDGGVNTYLYALTNPVRYTDPLGLWVKRCARKLGDPDNPPMTPSGNPIRHDYLSVSGEILSFQMGSNMFWSQGYIAENEHPSNDKCVMVCDDDEFDKYVLEAAEEIGAPTYCVIAYPGNLPHLLGARNCQTWADDVLNLAKKKYTENEDCPECFK